MAGIRQVAERAGVSISTVSRALRGLPRVSDTTRASVMDAASELGYVPSSTAASLVSGRTNAIAVVTPYVSRWFFGTVIDGLRRELAGAGYDVLLYDIDGDRDGRHKLFTRRLPSKQVDGVVVIAMPLRRDERAALQRLSAAVVIIGGDSTFPSVRIDDHDAGLTATAHLIELGHEVIAFVGCPKEKQHPYPPPYDRLVGYRRALLNAKLRVRHSLEIVGDFTTASGLAAGRALLALPDPPTGVVAASDEMAMGVLQAARLEGRRVPEDLSVIGIDDHEMSMILNLTTVAQPAREQGTLAARMVLDMLAGHDPPREPVVVDTALVLRGTTGPPRQRGTNVQA